MRSGPIPIAIAVSLFGGGGAICASALEAANSASSGMAVASARAATGLVDFIVWGSLLVVCLGGGSSGLAAGEGM